MSRTQCPNSSSAKDLKKLHSSIKFKRCNPAAVMFRHWGLVALQTATIGSKLLRTSQFSSALTAEDHSNIPSMDGDTYTEMIFFKFMPKLNQGKFKLLARTVLHPRSWNSLRRNISNTNAYLLGLPAAWYVKSHRNGGKHTKGISG